MSHAFGSQNIRHSEQKGNIQAVLGLVRSKFPGDLDVLAMQELTGSKKAWITQAMPGWSLWHKQAPTNGTGIAWDHSKWALVRKGLRVIYNPHKDGPVEHYNGRAMWEWRRYASWVILKDRKTNQVASFVCVHGKLSGEGKQNQWKKLKKLVTYLLNFGPVHIAGDMNTWKEDLPEWLRTEVVLSERIDHIASFGKHRIESRHRIQKSDLHNLVDHPGVAVGWSF